MPYKTLFVGNSVYEFYRATDQRILVMRRDYTAMPVALGADAPVVGQIEFESEEALDEQLRQFVPNNYADVE